MTHAQRRALARAADNQRDADCRPGTPASSQAMFRAMFPAGHEPMIDNRTPAQVHPEETS
jgi:hypothetical protein